MGENRIKELRKQKGLTQVELAKALNVSKGAVAMWETGQRTPTFEYLRPMSMLFNKNPDYILCYSDDASPISWAKPDQTLEQTAEQVLWLKTGRKAVDYILSCEYNRCSEQNTLFDISNLTFTLDIQAKKEQEEKEVQEEKEESAPSE